MNPEFAADGGVIDTGPFEARDRGAGDHRQFGKAGESAGDIQRQAAGEVILLGIAAVIDKRQHGDLGCREVG